MFLHSGIDAEDKWGTTEVATSVRNCGYGYGYEHSVTTDTGMRARCRHYHFYEIYHITEQCIAQYLLCYLILHARTLDNLLHSFHTDYIF